MKNFKLIIFGVLVAVAFSSCETDEEELPQLYSTIGMISISDDSVIVETDDNIRLFIVNPDLGDEIKDSNRVILYFYFTENVPPSGIDSIVEQYHIERVLVKPVIIFSDAIADSLGSDNIKVNVIGIAKDFLNLNFNFMGGFNVHNINITRDEGEIPADTVNLFIRHNSNGDSGGNWIPAFVSFDLNSLKNDVADSVVLRIRANDYDYVNYEKFLTYKYEKALD